MKMMQYFGFATILAFSSAFTTAAEVQNHALVKTEAKAQVASQHELVDLFLDAAKIGNQEVIEEFLKHGFPVDVKNSQGFTALMMATYYGHQPTVTTLLKHGADRCARDNKGNTALMGALFKMELAIAKQLSKVDCDAAAKKQGLKTVEDFAKVIGQSERLQQLLKD